MNLIQSRSLSRAINVVWMKKGSGAENSTCNFLILLYSNSAKYKTDIRKSFTVKPALITTCSETIQPNRPPSMATMLTVLYFLQAVIYLYYDTNCPTEPLLCLIEGSILGKFEGILERCLFGTGQ